MKYNNYNNYIIINYIKVKEQSLLIALIIMLSSVVIKLDKYLIGFKLIIWMALNNNRKRILNYN